MSQFVWFDHRSNQVDAAASFYESLLGWKKAGQSPPGMTAFSAEEGGRPWAGMSESEGIPTGWLPYIQVDDVDKATQKATKLGAKVVKERTKGPAGDFVVLNDPAGGVVALWQAA